MVHIVFVLAVLTAMFNLKGKRLFRLSFWILGLFAVLRYNFGNDYVSYHSWFDHIKSGGDSPYKSEIGFTFLNEISPSFYILIAITSIFFLVVVYKLIRSNLDQQYMGLAVLIFLINPYLFMLNLSSIRQCIAMCLFILSIKYAHQRSFLKYAALIVIATLFHTTSIILLPMYFVINARKVNRRDILAIAVVFVVLMVNTSIIQHTVDIGLAFFSNPNYNYYFSTGETNTLRATLLTGITFVYILMNLRHLEGQHLICGKLYLIGLAFGMLAYHFPMFTRVQMYFDIFSIVAIPGIMQYHAKVEESRNTRFIHLQMFPILIFLVYLLRYYSFFMNPMWASFTTYQTIFEALR